MTRSTKSIRLLVVGAQRSMNELIKEQAELCSHVQKIECAFADSGRKALRLLDSWQPSVVVLDVHLSDLNGFRVMELCQAKAASVIVASDHRSSAIEESARARGALGYMQWTDNPEEIETFMLQLGDMTDAEETVTH